MSILSSSSAMWIVPIVVGIFLVAYIIVDIFDKKHKKSQQSIIGNVNVTKEQKDIKSQEKNSDFLFLEKYYNPVINNVLGLFNNDDCKNVVNKFFESNVDNHLIDYGIFIIPSSYINRNVDEEDYDILADRMLNMRSFFNDKIATFRKSDTNYNKIEKQIYTFCSKEIDCLIDSYNLCVNEFDDAYYDRADLFDRINEQSELNYFTKISEVNKLFFGLNSLKILNNCSLETFYLYIGFEQEEYNSKILNDLCSKYSVDYKSTNKNVKQLISVISKLELDDNSRYLMSNQDNVLFELIDQISKNNGQNELIQFLTLIIHYSSNWNYENCVLFSEQALNGYNSLNVAKLTVSDLINGVKDRNSISIYDVDAMNGIEFEEFVAGLFTKLGYTTEVTKASGDQGVDVIAKKDGKMLGIQAKCYSGVVGNHAIMEVVAGMNYYGCNSCMVVTNSTFSASAKELAQANHVELWDRDDLKEQIELIRC